VESGVGRLRELVRELRPHAVAPYCRHAHRSPAWSSRLRFALFARVGIVICNRGRVCLHSAITPLASAAAADFVPESGALSGFDARFGIQGYVLVECASLDSRHGRSQLSRSLQGFSQLWYASGNLANGLSPGGDAVVAVLAPMLGAGSCMRMQKLGSSKILLNWSQSVMGRVKRRDFFGVPLFISDTWTIGPR
jgi:hypothetical protein